MRNEVYDEMWAEETEDEDWPPREAEEQDPHTLDNLNRFIAAVLEGAEYRDSSFTCPICGQRAYRRIARKYFAAKCSFCGINLMS